MIRNIKPEKTPEVKQENIDELKKAINKKLQIGVSEQYNTTVQRMNNSEGLKSESGPITKKAKDMRFLEKN